ncbi:PepSY domain-containing protein [Clostridiaceae bacterium NSJ-31]|uniref:PepSY domain-containing protein n=1 Tax=Ligaoa zhengdingensis TaxID=2763658 RepID=A0A926E062_9FIRM|nr:PepSY domain-containing protein [Ligaoa zhengdingensis]MBC8546644.1 PepSY domain-containing protein [Ligaoa zhengdingensis]
MQWKYRLSALAVSLALLAGCSAQQTALAHIDLEAAKIKALEQAGLTASEVEFTAATAGTRNGVDYYRVEFTADGQPYQFDIDAMTGLIIEESASDIPQGGDDSKSSSSSVEEGHPETDVDHFTAPSQSSQASSTASGEIITEKRAKEIALSHAGLKEADVTFVKSALDYDDGYQMYEVEFYTKDYKEYDYEIDARTGEIISYDYDAEDYTAPSSGKTISEQKAKELALSQVPGATANDILEFEVDHDDGRMEYEGKILYDGMEYEFEIDAYSGAIRSWEAEPIGR